MYEASDSGTHKGPVYPLPSTRILSQGGIQNLSERDPVRQRSKLFTILIGIFALFFLRLFLF